MISLCAAFPKLSIHEKPKPVVKSALSEELDEKHYGCESSMSDRIGFLSKTYILRPLKIAEKYYLEKTLHSHPSAYCREYKKLWRQYKQSKLKGTTSFANIVDFFKYIKSPRKFSHHIIYFNDESRKKHKVTCKEGILYQNDTPVHKLYKHPIFVIGPDQNLYLAKKTRKSLAHSSFFGGEAVLSAGKMRFRKNGEIESISNDSGHYKPSEIHLKYARLFLEGMGADLSHTLMDVKLRKK